MPDAPVYACRSLGRGMLIVCNAGMHQAGSTLIVIDLCKGAAASIADSTAVMLLVWLFRLCWSQSVMLVCTVCYVGLLC